MEPDEIGCEINLVTGEHYGPCKGSCKGDDMEHTPKIVSVAWEPAHSKSRYFRCSCGKSGSVEKTQGAALEAFARHVNEYEAKIALERIRDAAPALLSALENIAAMSGMTLLGGADAANHEQAHQDGANKAFNQAAEVARAAIKQAKGEAND